MQEISLQLLRAYPRFSPDRPFSTWMYRIALKAGISFPRRSSRSIRQTLPLEESAHELATETQPPGEGDERVELLQRVIAALDPLNRALIMLYLDECSYREIAPIDQPRDG